jgi:hypothetical protein
MDGARVALDKNLSEREMGACIMRLPVAGSSRQEKTWSGLLFPLDFRHSRHNHTGAEHVM